MKCEEVEGNLILMALEGKFDVIAHGCNCQCTMGAGLAPQMVKAFGCDKFEMELLTIEEQDDSGAFVKVLTNNKGNINKLGQIDYETKYLWFKHPMKKDDEFSVAMDPMTVGQSDVKKLIVVNAYTQFMYGVNHTDGVSKPLDYEALTLCLRKINHIFKGKHIGLPLIGCHLAGGIWDYTQLPQFECDNNLNEEYLQYANGIKKDVKTIIKQELKDMNVTIVHYKPN